MRDFIFGIVFYGAVLLLTWIGCAFFKNFYQITPRKARPQIEQVIGTTNYKILDQSNNSIWFGTPGDITYNIQTDSTVVSCRCTDGLFQPLICRKYQ